MNGYLFDTNICIFYLKVIDDFDLLIGSTAIHNQMVMVTDNESHLGRLNGIVVENWAKN